MKQKILLTNANLAAIADCQVSDKLLSYGSLAVPLHLILQKNKKVVKKKWL